ncbi:Ionotropic glutamate receptor L-glutamate and glycine-binding domain [Trinorchestia longiramus]|nr:Ionotropic glutamate receptor L-glutamate and glycine-binding domain [Trinorchestia longiramus]
MVLQAPPFPTLRDLRQQDLQGRTLQVSVLNNWPFFGVTHDEGGNLVPESGIDVSVVSTLGKIMNFSIQVVTPSDGEWGKKLPNGSWSGIIGMVTRREVNFAINEITSTGVSESL